MKGNTMDTNTHASYEEAQFTNWSHLRRITGIGGTYLWASLDRMDVSEEWLRRFYAQARGHGFRPRTHEGHLYLDLCR